MAAEEHRPKDERPSFVTARATGTATTSGTAMPAITVTLSGEALQALEDIRRRTGLSTADILKDALTLEKLYVDAHARGDQIMVGSGSSAQPIKLKHEG
jgi:hypothetical protein